MFKADLPSIHRPQLLLTFNNTGVWPPKSVTQTFRDGADTLNEALKFLRAKVHDLKCKTHAQYESQQLAILGIAKSIRLLNTSLEAHQNMMKYGEVEHQADVKAEYAHLYKEQICADQEPVSEHWPTCRVVGWLSRSGSPTPSNSSWHPRMFAAWPCITAHLWFLVACPQSPTQTPTHAHWRPQGDTVQQITRADQVVPPPPTELRPWSRNLARLYNHPKKCPEALVSDSSRHCVWGFGFKELGDW
ncbi:hypothetical protein DFH09DRAFT_1067435 [Mycena vulgaris]|nr:hypothetical protein DFH09DRAFT_1067435 [Mycena vulgaris]